MAESVKALYKKYHVIIMYALVGCGTIPINWGVYSLGVAAFGFPVFVANAIAWFLSSLFAYLGNKLVVFRSYCWLPSVLAMEAGSFFAIRGISAVFELVVQPVLANTELLGRELFGVLALPAKIVVTVVVVAMNFFLSKLFVFGRFKPRDEQR